MILFANKSLSEMQTEARRLVEKTLGRKIADADPINLLLQSLLSIIYQQHALINENARQNLLEYATGANLEALGELVGVKRHSATAAVTTLELKLSAAQAKATAIERGTRVTAGDGVYFATDSDVIFLAGESVKNVSATCLEVGETGNGYEVGTLNKLVDYQAYLKEVTNVTLSEGGSEIEDDESLRERIRLAPESFSVAGARGAYEFFAKAVSPTIIDAYVKSPTPGAVDVYILTEKGVPGAELLAAVTNALNADEVRPLTDFVQVKPPDTIFYNVDVKYWITSENKTRALSINAAVETAIEEYIIWQRGSLGRDISANELTYRLRLAGADRVEVLEPLFIATPPNTVALVNNVAVKYMGLKEL